MRNILKKATSKTSLALSLILILCITPNLSFAEDTNLKFTKLQAKDYDEMVDLVKAHVKKARELTEADNDKEAIRELEKTARILLSRPDRDSLVNRLFDPIKRQLKALNFYEETMVILSNEAIGRVKQEKLPTVYRATSLFVLENILSELRPELKTNLKLRAIVEKVKEEDIEIPRKVKSFRQMQGMYKTSNISETAKKLLQITETKAK